MPAGLSRREVVIQRADSGKSAAELVRLMGEEVGGKILLAKDVSPDQSIMEIDLDGFRLKIVVNVDGDKFCAVTMSGPDEEAMVKLMDSLVWRSVATVPLPQADSRPPSESPIFPNRSGKSCAYQHLIPTILPDASGLIRTVSEWGIRKIKSANALRSMAD
ncbi:MAG: hypothetical protein K6F46_09940 [Desulfovibrio sp.]|nr:hypothetical protein [Desulfovibrio sp.]